MPEQKFQIKTIKRTDFMFLRRFLVWNHHLSCALPGRLISRWGLIMSHGPYPSRFFTSALNPPAQDAGSVFSASRSRPP